MPHDSVSRRQFLHNAATGSAGAALGTSLAGVPAANTGTAADPPLPHTMESYPIVEPGKGAAVNHMKIVSMENMADLYSKSIRALSSGIELHTGLTSADFRRELADAHAVFGGFSRDDFAAARNLRWIQISAAGVEHILWPEVVQSPVILTNMQRIYAPVISETAIGLMLRSPGGSRAIACRPSSTSGNNSRDCRKSAA